MEITIKLNGDADDIVELLQGVQGMGATEIVSIHGDQIDSLAGDLSELRPYTRRIHDRVCVAEMCGQENRQAIGTTKRLVDEMVARLARMEDLLRPCGQVFNEGESSEWTCALLRAQGACGGCGTTGCPSAVQR